MGAQTSFFSSEGAPFDVLSEAFGAFPSHQKQVLESVVTGDVTMVLYYVPLSKRESMEWRKPGEAPPRKAKVTQSTKKLMATMFWDCRGIVLIDF